MLSPLPFTEFICFAIASLQESCCIYTNGDSKLEKRLENFEKVSAGMLIEYNIFFGGSVLTKRRPAWFDVCCIILPTAYCVFIRVNRQTLC